MAKPDKQSDAETDDTEDGDKPAEGEKQGFVKKLLGNKKLLMIAGGGLLLLLIGAGAGLYFFVFAAEDEPIEATASNVPQIPATPPQVAYYDIPDLIVNLQSIDGSPVYLKLSLSLELYTAEEKAGIQALIPRIVDQYQGYLRELRADDLKGSAGIMRVKEELLRRSNVAAAPYRVRDVLLKEMIIQ
jgi:flagellar protein FliL